MNILLLILIGISLLYEQDAQALVVGSNSAVSIVTTCTMFPAADTDNTIKGFVWLKYGYQFEDATTSCTFDAVYPITGTVDLKGGTLYLLQDMILANSTQLKGLGNIIGNGHSIEFCESITALPVNLTTIQDLNVFFDGDMVIQGSLLVQGHCIINGTGQGIKMGNDVVVAIDTDSTLEVQNARLENVNNNIGCLSDTSHLIIQDVLACITGDSHFIHGAITVQHNVSFTGPYTFWYDSAQPCLIDYAASLRLDGGLKLKCGRKTVEGPSPLLFYDSSSILKCGECSILITATGTTLTRGRFEVEKNITIEAESTVTTYGITIGDGESSEEDLTIYCGGGSFITFAAPVIYKNVEPDRFYSAGPSASFLRKLTGSFFLATTCIYPQSVAYFEVNGSQVAPTILAEGVTLFYNNMHVVVPGLNEVTYYASRTNQYSCLLNGYNYIYLASGLFVDPLWINGKGNMISGNGTIESPIILLDGNAELLLNLNGSMYNTISLNGGTIRLYNDIVMSCDHCFSTSGTIDLGANTLSFDYAQNSITDEGFDCSMTWSGNNGLISLSDSITLVTTWTFHGNITIDGNGNVMNLADGGRLVIDEGASLSLKNLRLNLIDSGYITCVDDDGELVLDNVHWVQDGNFAFTAGSLRFKDNVLMSGQGLVFAYQSTQTVTIDYDSTLDLDYRFTFSYDPTNDSPSLLQFKDFSSRLGLSKSILYAIPGLHMTNGQLLIKDDASIYALGEGLTLGAQASANDMTLIFNNQYIFQLVQGTLSYKNVLADSLQMNNNSMIEIGEGTQLNVFEDIYLQSGSLLFDMNAKCAFATGKQIIGSVSGSWVPTTTVKGS